MVPTPRAAHRALARRGSDAERSGPGPGRAGGVARVVVGLALAVSRLRGEGLVLVLAVAVTPCGCHPWPIDPLGRVGRAITLPCPARRPRPVLEHSARRGRQDGA